MQKTDGTGFFRRSILSAGFALACLVQPSAWLAAHAQAAPYPSKPITMLVPFPPGGPTDLVARILAQKLSAQLGQPVIIDNKPGANGNIAAAQVSKAQGDGYTLLYNTSSITLSPSLYKNMAYDVLHDLRPVALTAVVPLALVVHPTIPSANIQEFVAYAKAHPGKLSYGSAGNGNVTHLAAYQFVQAQGLDAAHVPYRGSAPADVDLVAGQIQFMTDTINSAMPFIKDGRMKLLAVTTPKRMAIFPHAPTLNETVMPGFEAGAWQGIMLPASTPDEIAQRLNMEVNRALQNPDIREKLAQQGAEPLGSSPEAYGEYIRKELDRWAKVVKATSVTLN